MNRNEDQVVDAQHDPPRRSGSPSERMDARVQLVERGRFARIVISARVEASDNVRGLGAPSKR